jgi:hypothetical protein
VTEAAAMQKRFLPFSPKMEFPFFSSAMGDGTRAAFYSAALD